MSSSPEDYSSFIPAGVQETERRQLQALRTVQIISRAAGRELPILPIIDGTFPDNPGVYIFDPEIATHGRIKDASFSVDRRRISGAADSAHAVIAGELTVEFDNPRECPSSVSIAAKCYQKRTLPERLDRARREVEFMREMGVEGALTMQPVAVAVTGPEHDSNVVLITAFDEDLFTLDNAPWHRGTTPANVTDAILCAQAVGAFNATGRKHGDAKIKNVASKNSDGAKRGMIDFETASHFDPSDPLAAADATHADLGLMLQNLESKGLFDVHTAGFGNNAHQVVDAIRSICEDGYLPSWESSPPAVQDAVYNEVVELARTVEAHIAPRFAHSSV